MSCTAWPNGFYDKAMHYGFKPEQIFFDSTVFPLAIDMPMEPGVPGYTYRAFETIKNSSSDADEAFTARWASATAAGPAGAEVGVCRAYVAKAMEYGLDAGIVNTSHQYGRKEPDPDLLKLINTYAALDGTPDKLSEADQVDGAILCLSPKTDIEPFCNLFP